MLHRDSNLRAKYINELISQFNTAPPKIVVVRKDDTWWRETTSFNEWSTSYQEIMKIPSIRNQLLTNYKIPINYSSFIVFEKK